MAALPYSRIAASKMFTILLGPDKKPFTIHADLLAAQSKPLDALVNGKMKEAVEGTAEWPEVDKETFIRFWEFAYTGTYSSSDPVSIIEQRINEEEPKISKKRKRAERQAIEDEEIVTSTSRKIRCRFRRRARSQDLAIDQTASPAALERTLSLQGPLPSQAVPPSEPPTEKSQGQGSSNLLEFILAHARVYVLADYYDVQALAELSLEKLRDAFHQIPKKLYMANDLAAVAEYTYQNTIDKGGCMDPLRELVSNTIAERIEPLWSHPTFKEALEASGELSKDVIGKMVLRLP
ncbi:hypothetical protein F5Y16DRAFT_402059 [Xylariaceae sp. FL0255]|nr:hypothetical protein F5Y16DRAFT_402059 [Xylariaceae sp. FL0255]